MPEVQDAPYDPYIPSGGQAAGGQNANGDPRTQALQAAELKQDRTSDEASETKQQIDDTVNVMKQNIHLASQRGQHLDALQDKTDNLAHSAQGFRRGANRVRKQMWWKDMKMRMWIVLGVIILLVIIIVPSGTFLSLPVSGIFRA
ncbi:hypothetical protein TD95_001712 [Thielaviopsis punctulata]|uniref:V-SNARE coiled-coil homology domain-containing protein n=1 Tax=Thielaviopsis punctulata TaxID=72032 RepID=A0A0F4ZAR0_9PEZI|nr:hypothetical protein TD95_001712 [Thielaviopsis punctulata]